MKFVHKKPLLCTVLIQNVKYHDVFNTENQIVIADIGHFESEQCIKEVFYEQLSKNFINFAILMADSDKSPTENYYRSDY